MSELARRSSVYLMVKGFVHLRIVETQFDIQVSEIVQPLRPRIDGEEHEREQGREYDRQPLPWSFRRPHPITTDLRAVARQRGFVGSTSRCPL
jgi:hypothetical protein